jgi:hypothetical protein
LVGVARGQRSRRAADACIVYQQVDGAQFGFDPGYRPVHVVAVGDVRPYRQSLAAAGLDHGRGGRYFVLGAGAGGYGGTGGAEG